MSSLADAYLRWAELEARGSSSCYEEWARSMAADPDVLALVERLPRSRRQPNLVFAAARAAGAPVGRYVELRPWILAHWPSVEAVALARSTQTNEPARCAVLLPALARLDGPLALVEVGASAGLCLLPDRYSYRYATPDGTVSLDPASGPSHVVLDCRAPDAALVPARLPDVVWRAGLDLNPLDVTEADDVDWLRTLVWPEHEGRRRRLDAACALAAADPPRVVRGDLLDDLDGVLRGAPADAHVVVFHSAVLAYVDESRRERFVARMQELDGTWIANEGVRVLPASRSLPDDGRFVLSVNGEPVARTDPHGAGVWALGGAAASRPSTHGAGRPPLVDLGGDRRAACIRNTGYEFVGSVTR